MGKREDLVAKARDEYGIVNADQMQDSQLNAEIKAIDEQAKSVNEESQDEAKTETKKSSNKSSR